MLLLATTQGEFAAKLSGLLWKVYGTPLKIAACVAFVVLFGVPLCMFVKRLMR